MQSITVRLATSNDLKDLADIWYESQILNQQTAVGSTVVSGAREQWIEEASHWLDNSRCALWAALRNDMRLGYLTIWLQDMPPGVTPPQIGCVTDMALDLHTPSSGVGQSLLNAARGWLANQGIKDMVAYVPHRQPVQQAFWQGQGAKNWVDLMWLKL